MFRRVMTAAEAQKKTEKQHKKRLLKLIEEEKQDVYNRIMESVNRGNNCYIYTSFDSPDGELYSEVKNWLVSLGYQVEYDYVKIGWKITW